MKRKKWDPVAEPWRVVRYFRTAARGCHGWRATSETFASEEEALAAVRERMPRGCFKVVLDFAENSDRWGEAGRWLPIASRKINKRLRVTGRRPMAEALER